MILSCPSCATRYLIDPAALGETGRLVRCARCSHSWTERPPQDIPKQVDVLPPPEQPEKVTPLPPGSNLPALNNAPRRRGWIGWAALVLVVVGIAAGAYFQRETIIEKWPDALLIYGRLGFGEEAQDLGLELSNVKQTTSIVNDQTVVTLFGEIVNISDQPQDVPRIVADIMDKNRDVIRTWIVTPRASRLEPGEKTEFEDDYTDPPKEAVQISVRFEGAE
jgi:predicted Zn finger-like uncharacterized protein